MLVVLGIIFAINIDTGQKATIVTIDNFKIMLGVMPAILILIGLLDVWVPKEVMIKYMGEKSGIKGILVALTLGSLAAGPLYAAFPVAAILIKKQARFAYVLFFLGAWSSSKLPLIVFEYTSFGGLFTAIHVVSNLLIFLVGAFLIEKIISKEYIDGVYEKVSNMTSA